MATRVNIRVRGDDGLSLWLYRYVGEHSLDTVCSDICQHLAHPEGSWRRQYGFLNAMLRQNHKSRVYDYAVTKQMHGDATMLYDVFFRENGSAGIIRVYERPPGELPPVTLIKLDGLKPMNEVAFLRYRASRLSEDGVALASAGRKD